MNKLCAHHLCGKYFEVQRFGQQYCDPRCRDNAERWRWRKRHPKRYAARVARWAATARKKRAVAYTKKRRALGSLTAAVSRARKARADGRKNLADQVD